MELASKECVPCRGGIPPLTSDECQALSQQLGNSWEVVDNHHLSKEFTFKDFVEALAFVNRVAEIAEAQNHHPDLHLAWGKVRVEIWTHKIGGLTESDFILAAKSDQCNQPD
jgi:4a-hydroxytetrahydrobiopterin dehydratase